MSWAQAKVAYPLTGLPVRVNAVRMVPGEKDLAPLRRVLKTVARAGARQVDLLECGHHEAGQCMAKRRRCHSCADPTYRFPSEVLVRGASDAPQTRTEVRVGPLEDSRVDSRIDEAAAAHHLEQGSRSARPDDPPDQEAAAPRPSADVLMTVEEVAELLRVGRNSIYHAIGRGELPGVRRIGRTIRILRSALLGWFAEEDRQPTRRRR